MSISRFVLSAAILLSAASCGGSSPTTPTPTPAGVAVAIQPGARTMGNLAYAPNPATVSVGTTVTWTNTDAITHTLTSDTGAFHSGTLAPGATFSFTFQARGNFPYHCTPHQSRSEERRVGKECRSRWS